MLYLVRHGEAVDEKEDPSRPLSARGRAEVEALAQAGGSAAGEMARILHSGKLRARQTAEIWAAALRPAPPLEEREGLDPMDDPRDAAALAPAVGESMMLVGHLPHLSRLTSLLVLGDPDRSLVTLLPGSIVALDRQDRGWRIHWLLTPALAGALPARA